ncbi:MAG: MBL fold metallo-hydrolase [Deltaproteobacteria bacterium]|nr:MBL fold metallo-hydrolase [Deltaproteobacteria bacterium]
MLTNQTWQPLPGTRQAEIYPYLRRPDVLSSNSCLIRTPDQIILIDAGALASQTAELGRILTECQSLRSRPVMIYLTHCHIDHSLQVAAQRQMVTTAPVWIAVQEEGAVCLIDGDRDKTIAELYGTTFPSMQPDIRLLTAQDRKRHASRRIAVAPGVVLTLHMEDVPTDRGKPWVRQVISMGGGDHLEVYPLPGHSPDSVCIRIGEVLFIGDLLTAANPMVAGISGWHRDDLSDSLSRVRWLLDHMPIRSCFPGHGAMIPADKVRGILENLNRKTQCLDDVTQMNEERLFQITDYALELIDEAEEAFSAIAGRLLYAAHQLEQLEEADAARRCRAAMNMDEIDACLSEFRAICGRFADEKMLRVEFAHGALRVIEKMKSLFDPRPLSAVLPQSLINQGTSLLLDFIGIANGRRNLEEFIPTDVNALIGDVLQAWQVNPHQDTAVIDQADDDEKYLAALVLRVGCGPSVSRPAVNFTAWQNLPFVRIAAGRFFNTLMNFLDWLRLAAPSSIDMTTAGDFSNPVICVLPKGWKGGAPTPHEEKKINSFGRRFRLCGLILTAQEDGFRLTPAENQAEPRR